MNYWQMYARDSYELNESVIGWAGRVERALGKTAPEWLPDFEVGYQLPPDMEPDDATSEVANKLLTERIPALAKIMKALRRELGPL